MELTLLELVGLIFGGGGLIGFVVGLFTIKYQRKTALYEAEMKRQDYYQEMADDLHYDEMSQQEKEGLAQLVQSQISFDETPQADSDRTVKSKGIKAALDEKVDKVTGKQLSADIRKCNT